MSTSKKRLSLPPRPPFFSGRETFLHNLHEALLRKSIVVVTGAAGTGKTAAVLEYAYRHANSYQRVIWIDARTHELFLAAALELAEEFSLPVATARDAQDIFQTIQNWLFEQPDTLFNLAGAYLRVNPCPFEDYLALYHRFPLSLKLLAGANERPLEACYGCTAASLEAPAQTLLHLCTFLAPDAIPSALFYQAVVLRKLWPASPVVDASSVDTLIERLQACGLITRLHRPDMLEMPSLLQTVVRQRLPLDQQQQYVELALRAFHALLCAAEAEMLAERLRLAGHIRQLSASSEEWTISFSEAASVFNWAGSLLWEQGLLREAEPLLNRGLTIWERVLGSTHPLVATLSLNLAVINMQLERYTSAESLARRAITAKAHAPGATHADVLLALNNLGRIYAHQKKYSSAKLCYEKALAIGKHGKLEAHPTCVASLYDLAMLEIEQEHFTSAEPLLRQVCTIWERATESERLQAWQSLAEISMRLGKWKQARKYFLRLLPAHHILDRYWSC